MNFKNIKEKITNRINKQNLKVFFQKQGLYVLIFLCVAAAGITAIVAWPRDNTEQIGDSGTDASVNEGTTLEEELAANATSSPKPSASKTPTPSPSEQANDNAQPVVNNGSGSIILKKPISGKVINAFSGDEFVYFASLNVWQTHNGIDIQAEKGTPVLAALSGTVAEANVNEADGGVVIINHSDKAQTVYAGLDNISVKQGDKVSVGDQIAQIGEMPTELDLSYHLHFEYIVDNVYKDPAKFMEK